LEESYLRLVLSEQVIFASLMYYLAPLCDSDGSSVIGNIHGFLIKFN